jgi:O-antigen/teichoic acid export membrane protein
VQPVYSHDYWVNDTLPLPVFDGRPGPVIRDRRVQLPPPGPPGSGSQNRVARLWAGLRDPVYRGSYALVANTVGTSVIGAVYWAVAAHLYGPADLGRATALISALMLVATLSQLNLSSTLMRFLPQMGAISAGRLIKFCYLVTTLTALAGSVIFVTVMPRLSSEWHFVDDSAFFVVIFAVSVVVWEVFTLQDAALVGLQRAVAVPVENVIYSLAKLALLVVAAEVLGSTDVLFSWIAPLILLIPVINWLIFYRCLKDRSQYDTGPPMRVRQLARFASVDYGGVICGQITGNVLPLLVISVLGPDAAGSFYIASLITTGVATVGANFSTGLLVEGTAAPERLAEITRGALKRCLIILGPATIVLVLGAHVILKVYGGSYIAQTAVLFQLLALSLIPFCIETVAYSLDRIAGKPIRATLSQLAVAVLTLGGSALLFGRLGLNAVGVAVLGADLVVAFVRLPTVLAAVRRRPGVIAPPAAAAQARRPAATASPAAAAQPWRPAATAPPPAGAAQPRRPAATAPPPAGAAQPRRPAVTVPPAAAAQPRRPAVSAPPPAAAAQPRRPAATAPPPAAAAQPRRPGVAAPPPAAAAQPVPVPGSHAQPDSSRDTDRRNRDTDRRNYAGRHRAPGRGEAAPTDR